MNQIGGDRDEEVRKKGRVMWGCREESKEEVESGG